MIVSIRYFSSEMKRVKDTLAAEVSKENEKLDIDKEC